MLLGPNHPHPEKIGFCRCLHPISETGRTSRKKKCHLESGLNQQDRATAGFVRVYTHRKPGKIFYWRGFFLASHFRASIDLPKKKSHLESGLNKRDRATGGFVGVYTHRKPGKKIDVRGFLSLYHSKRRRAPLLYAKQFRSGLGPSKGPAPETQDIGPGRQMPFFSSVVSAVVAAGAAFVAG